MKKTAPILIAIAALSQPALAATIAYWDFETNNPPATAFTGQTCPGIAADTGNGTASGYHASAATAWINYDGSLPAIDHSLGCNNWAVGDYYQFQTSTSGYRDIQISWDIRASNTGPQDFDLEYSTDGSSFIVATTTQTAAGAVWVYGAGFDCSSIAAIENAPTLYFRLKNSTTDAAGGTGTIQPAGTTRIDNILITGSPVPEPAASAALAAGFAILALLARRRRPS